MARRTKNKRQRGLLSAQLLPLWILVLSVFGVSLWIKAKGLQYLKAQRTLDRCVYRSIKDRCDLLSRLSWSNSILKKELKALAAIKSAKTVGSLVPIAGEVLAIAGEVSEKALSTGIRATVGYQNLLISGEKLSLPLIFKCGIPWRIKSLQFKRPRTFTSTLAQSTPALTWEQSYSASEIWIKKPGIISSMPVESFAHCEPTSSESAMNGEKYQIRFYHPQTASSTNVQVNAFRSWFSF